MTLCNVMEVAREFSAEPPVPARDVPDGQASLDSLEEKIMDFLEGRSRGGELLHALYDRILAEPIPERMRALFKE